MVAIKHGVAVAKAFKVAPPDDDYDDHEPKGLALLPWKWTLGGWVEAPLPS